jgi:hypothetical protein
MLHLLNHIIPYYHWPFNFTTQTTWNETVWQDQNVIVFMQAALY